MLMEKVLIALVAAASHRNTHENIKMWTKNALEDIGLNASELPAPDE